MFGFDMIVHGIRGDQLPEDMFSEEELEVYGVDWEALQDNVMLQSQRDNNSDHEGWTSWVGQTGPPPQLSEVTVDPPSDPQLQPGELEHLDDAISTWMHGGSAEHVIALWTQGLAYARVMYNGF